MDAVQRLTMIAERERRKRQGQEPPNRTPPPPAAPAAGQPQPARPDRSGLETKG